MGIWKEPFVNSLIHTTLSAGRHLARWALWHSTGKTLEPRRR